MAVDVLIEAEAWERLGLEALAGRAVAETLGHCGVDPEAEVAILACDDARIAELNSAFRDRSAATNVLSWPSEERGAEDEGAMPEPPEDAELGDIAIAYETCAREAETAGISAEAHTTHLIVHATLHLLGHDHIREGDAELMERLEIEILAKLGLPDPYSR